MAPLLPLPGSSVVEQVTVNHLVVGSIPTRAANLYGACYPLAISRYRRPRGRLGKPAAVAQGHPAEFRPDSEALLLHGFPDTDPQNGGELYGVVNGKRRERCQDRRIHTGWMNAKKTFAVTITGVVR